MDSKHRLTTFHDETLCPIEQIERISVGSIFGWAHAVLSHKWGLLVGCAFFLAIYGFVAGIVLTILDGLLVGYSAYLSPFQFIHSITVTTPLSVGPVYIAARTFRGQEAGFEHILIGFRRWVPVMCIAIILQGSLALAMVPIGISMAFLTTATATTGFTVLIMVCLGLVLGVLAIYISVRVYFATLLCADPLGPKLGVFSSIKESWRITERHAMTLCLSTILIGLIVMVTMLLLLLPGLLYGIPLSYAAIGGVYVFLTHKYGIIPVKGYDDCPYCGYDLRNLETTTCPECGADVQRDWGNEDEGSGFAPVALGRSDLMSMPLPDIPLAEPDTEPGDDQPAG